MKTFIKKCDLLVYTVFTFVEKYFKIIMPAYFLSFIIGYYLAIWDVTWAWISWGILLAFLTIFYLICCAYHYLRYKL